MAKDIFVVTTSDWHSGSIEAPLPDRVLQLRSLRNLQPNDLQKKLYAHLMACAEYVKAQRKKKELVLVHNGDAIEGIHHNSIEHNSPDWDDHVEIHKELMTDFRKAAGITASDKCYYVSGTQSHTARTEEGIAEYFDAEPAGQVGDVTLRLHHELKLDINGRAYWWTHHGAKPGNGANEGNAVRNWLRDIYWDCKRDGAKPPDFIYSSHYHKDHYDAYIDDYHVLHGHVIPSFQRKTRFALQVAPFQRNDIGMAFSEVSADGLIKVHRSLLMKELA